MLKLFPFLTFALICLSNGVYSADGDFFFKETFDYVDGKGIFETGKWIKSTDSKYSKQDASVTTSGASEDDSELILNRANVHYGIVAPFQTPLDVTNKDFVLQYELKFDEDPTCGGAYLKILEKTSYFKASKLNNDSPYIIMFGPDRCGLTNKVHFILRHQNPKSLEWEEKHMKQNIEMKTDHNTHLYTLVIRTDNSFEIFIDQLSVSHGHLLSDLEPPIVPPQQIEDPEDSQPEKWDDREFIIDSEAVKPDDWDENEPQSIIDEDALMPYDWLLNEEEQIPDPSTQKPMDWDDEEDGEFEAALIPNPKCEFNGCGQWKKPIIQNPKYKGKWTPPKIKNPEFDGIWAPRKINNPNYFFEEHPHNLPLMSGLAIEIWTTFDGIRFDNILISSSEKEAYEYGYSTWKPKYDIIYAQERKKRDDKRQLEIERQRAEGGFANMAEVYLNDFVVLANENLIAFSATLVALFLGIVFMCTRGGNEVVEEQPVARPKKRDAPVVVEKSDDNETKDETPVEDETESEEIVEEVLEVKENEEKSEDKKDKSDSEEKKKKKKKDKEVKPVVEEPKKQRTRRDH